jgi:hypothetical protein
MSEQTHARTLGRLSDFARTAPSRTAPSRTARIYTHQAATESCFSRETEHTACDSVRFDYLKHAYVEAAVRSAGAAKRWVDA